MTSPMYGENHGVFLVAFIVLIAAGTAGLGYALATGDEHRERFDDWCANQGGEIIRMHDDVAGYYCDLPNGTVVHLRDYPETEEP